MRKLQKGMRGEERNRKAAFWLLSCALFALASAYVYFVNTAALNAVAWEKAEAKSALLSGVVSDLEENYLSRKRAVTLSLAYRAGFQDVRTVTYISSKTLGSAAQPHGL